jgi:hypothetical protein
MLRRLDPKQRIPTLQPGSPMGDSGLPNPLRGEGRPRWS